MSGIYGLQDFVSFERFLFSELPRLIFNALMFPFC